MPTQKRSKPNATGISRALAALGLAVVMAALLALIPVSRAAACYCIGPSTAKDAKRNSSVAFVGVAAAVSLRSGKDRDGYLDWTVLYRFGVEEVVKGTPGDWIDIATSGSGASCGVSFLLGSRWRVYAGEKEAGVPISHLCSGSVLLDMVAPVPSGVPYPTASVREPAPLKLPSSRPATPEPAAADPTVQASEEAAQSDGPQDYGLPTPVIAGGAALALLIAIGGVWALSRRRSARC